MVTYDPREIKDRITAPLSRLMGADRHGEGRQHFVFSVNNKRIAYCYIRKNASTCFKNIITSFSEHRSLCPRDKNPIQFMKKYHGESSLSRLEACDARLFVYRCPIRRITSLFVNKFVMRSEAEDIFHNVENVTRKDVAAITFQDFVELYLCSHNLRTLDPHVLPQSRHLHKMRYTHAIFIGDLNIEMEKLLGRDIAREYFHERINASSLEHEKKMKDLSVTTAQELWNHYEGNGIVPKHEQLARDNIVAKLETLYRKDVKMFRLLMEKRERRKRNIMRLLKR